MHLYILNSYKLPSITVGNSAEPAKKPNRLPAIYYKNPATVFAFVTSIRIVFKEQIYDSRNSL